MSTIGSINGNQQSIYQWLSQAAGGAVRKGDDGDNDATRTGVAGAAASQGSQAGGLGALRQQILSAVSDAVGKLDKTSSPQEVASAIQGAVQNTLKQNGIDPAQFQQGSGAGGGHHHGHAHGGGGKSGSKSAIDQILQQNGFDPQAVRQVFADQTNTSTSDIPAASAVDASQATDLLHVAQTIVSGSGVDTKA